MDQVIKAATVDISHYIVRLLYKQSKQNVSTISKYIRAMIAEINPSTSYIENQIKTLIFQLLPDKCHSQKCQEMILCYMLYIRYLKIPG
jgi:hypothetical protein